MERKQAVKRALVGLLAGITIGTSARIIQNNINNKSYEAPSKSISRISNMTLEKEEFKVHTLMASIETNEYGQTIYRVPEGYVLFGNKGYQIERICYYSYPAAQLVNENGTKTYFAPHGGTLSGNKVLVSYSTFLSKEAIYEYLKEKGFIIEAEATLKLSI